MDCLFKNIEDLNSLSAVLKERFAGKYPTRKAYTTDFIRSGILFQIDAIAYTNSWCWKSDDLPGHNRYEDFDLEVLNDNGVMDNKYTNDFK